MLGPSDGVLGGGQAGRQAAMLPFGLAAQDRKLERRHIDAPNLMAAGLGAAHVGFLQRMAEMALTAVRMALDQENALTHAMPQMAMPSGNYQSSPVWVAYPWRTVPSLKGDASPDSALKFPTHFEYGNENRVRTREAL